MTWYFYVARPNEIFCDLDSRRAVARAEWVIREAKKRKLLAIQSAWLFKSENHFHMVVTLKKPMDAVLRATWALWMGSDRVRGIQTIARIQSGVKAPDLLITPYQWRRLFEDGGRTRKPESWLFRKSDGQCICKRDHKSPYEYCATLKRLRGKDVDLFPRREAREEPKPGRVKL